MWGFATVNGISDSASAKVTVRKVGSPPSDSMPAPARPTITIRRVEPANVDRSFTSLTDEHTIILEADVTPASLATAVHWTIADLTTDHVDSPLPGTVKDGAVSSFDLPVDRLSRDRWPKTHPSSTAGPYQSLAYQVVASVTAGNVTISSTPRMISQDAYDTIRQEFIDLQVPKGVPKREMIGPHWGNQGDYLVNVTNAKFDQVFDQLHAAWGTRDWQVNGYFRNPVHNAFHVNRGKSSGTVPGSWHQYGCAADLQTFPLINDRSPKADTVQALAFWNDLVAEAKKLHLLTEPLGAKKKGNAYSGIGHVHVHIECYP